MYDLYDLIKLCDIFFPIQVVYRVQRLPRLQIHWAKPSNPVESAQHGRLKSQISLGRIPSYKVVSNPAWLTRSHRRIEGQEKKKRAWRGRPWKASRNAWPPSKASTSLAPSATKPPTPPSESPRSSTSSPATPPSSSVLPLPHPLPLSLFLPPEP